jgi:hypothetical protein
MKKIISLFQRNYDGDRLVRNEVTPGAEWVIAGEGEATRKFDGTCCLIRAGRFYKRHEVKPGGTPPPDFEPANEIDGNTGKQQGWLPVGAGPEDRYHREAFDRAASEGAVPVDGTYELCGPKVQGNPEGRPDHELIRHGAVRLSDCPREFEALRDCLRERSYEGIVWHHPDGRMVKIKARDFGFRPRPAE